MTEEEIRGLDGAAFMRLAWKLGLAPPDVTWPPGCAYAYGEDELAWRPWSRLAQADVVFRGLRARGWWTDVQGDATEWWARATREEVEIVAVGPRPENPTEAITLLRCAVLAVTHDAAKEPHADTP